MKTGSALLVCLTVLFLPGRSIGEKGPEPEEYLLDSVNEYLAETVVAVLGIHDEAGILEEDQLSALTEYLAASVAECGTYRIVPPWDIKKLEKLEKLASGREYFDPEFQLELAAQLGVGLYVSTSITRTADTCTVVSALDSVKRQTQLIAARARGD